MSHPLKQKFSPRLLAKYPQYDYPDEDSFPSYIPMFCFPNDIMIKESEDCPPATFHGFVMTQEDGSKRYGVCLTTYYAPLPDHLIEELEILHKKWCEANMAPSELEYIKHLLEKVRQERRRVETAKATLSLQRSSNTTMGDNNDELDEILKEKADAEDKLELYLQLLEPIKLGVFDSTKLWLPKAIGIVSHFPWHDILKDWLCAVVMPMVDSLKENNHNQLKTRLPLERYIVNLVHEIPLPPPGKAQVAISVNDMTLFCSRPALNQKPILKDYSLYPLFRSLSFNTIMTLFEVALSEGKILLISSFPDMLYLVAHSITYLLYPFYWQGVFIPVLPARLMACLQAPVPYIMGIERQYKGMDLLPEDACIVDIDRDTVLIAEQPIQIPPRQRKKLLQSLGSYVPLHQSNHHNHPHYSVPYGIPLYIQQAYPNNRFTPHHTSTRSKIGDERSGNSISKIGSVVGRPAQPISLAPLMSKFQKLEIDPQAQAQFDEHLASLNKISNNNNGNNANHTNNNNNNLLNVLNNNNKFGRSSESIINNTNSLQKRFSNFNPSFDKFGENRDENMHLNPDKHPKRIKNRFSSITGGARNSIISIRNKALARNSVFGVNKIVTPLKISHTAPSSIDIRLSPPQLSMSSSSEATSNSSIDNLSLFDDGMSVMSVLTESEQRVLPEKNYIPKEGHLMAQILNDDDDEQFTGKCGMNILIFEGIACGICNESLGINLIYKCEGCSMMIHEECLSDIVYPCVPACFNEAKVQDAFLRVFSSFLQNYRSFMLNNNDNSNDGPINNYSRSGESNEFLDDSEVFNKDLFLKSVDRESKPFLSQLVDSQAFSQFINQRVNAKKTSVRDYDVQYFDEVIKAKLNRSKLRFSKESTTFLDDSTYAISQTIRSMKPNEEGLEEQDFEGYIHLPDSFDHGIMNNPRPIKKVWL